VAGVRVVGVDVGSVSHRSGSRFAWAAFDCAIRDADASLACQEVGTGRDPASAVAAIGEALRAGRLVALGMECPLLVPVPADWRDLGRGREGEAQRAWSAGAGPAAMATGLVQLAWLLRELASGGQVRATTQPGRWSQAQPLLLWEAFVSQSAKTGTGEDAHLADARAAVRAFISGLPATSGRSDVHVGDHRALNLAAVAAAHAGIRIDPAELASNLLIVKARPV
jgi:hypothetical protein